MSNKKKRVITLTQAELMYMGKRMRAPLYADGKKYVAGTVVQVTQRADMFIILHIDDGKKVWKARQNKAILS